MAKFYSLLILMVLVLGAMVFANPTFTLTSGSRVADVGDTVQVTLSFVAGGPVGSFTNFDLTTTGLTLSFLPADIGCEFVDNIGHCEYFGFPANPLVFTALVISLPATITVERAEVSASGDLTDLTVSLVGSPLTIQTVAQGPNCPNQCVIGTLSCAGQSTPQICQAVAGACTTLENNGALCVNGVSSCVNGACVDNDAPLSHEDLLTQLEAVLRDNGLHRLQQISRIARLLMEGDVQ